MNVGKLTIMKATRQTRPPRRNNDRVILHFVSGSPLFSLCRQGIHATDFLDQDYDCFYAQVVENRQPVLKSMPLGIKQKSILATCNYEARRRGVKKLALIAEARKVCPELILVDGEDLSPFRDVSKRLHNLLRKHSWNSKVERLGLDEVFVDVTDIVEYNSQFLNRNSLAHSFFHLSRQDPAHGFVFDATSIAGCVYRNVPTTSDDTDLNSLQMRLLLASHLARYLRFKLEEEGYTCACGISTNKLLAKLVGSVHKPRNQTTLPPGEDDSVQAFMDRHALRKVPGFGSRITRTLENYVSRTRLAGHDMKQNDDGTCTVGDVRTLPEMSPQLLERLLGGHGPERAIGARVWGLLHGVDNTEVKDASDVPLQISIENTYKGLRTAEEITRELKLLSASLLRRMHLDLADECEESGLVDRVEPSQSTRAKFWKAHPATLRLSTRPKTSAAEGKPYNWARTSRSQALPTYVFNFSTPPEQIVDQLAKHTLLPMLTQMNPKKGGWRIGMLNVCVTNMKLVAGASEASRKARDIGAMFKRQELTLRECTTYEGKGLDIKKQTTRGALHGQNTMDVEAIEAETSQGKLPRSYDGIIDGRADDIAPAEGGYEDDVEDSWEMDDSDSLSGVSDLCTVCDHLIPRFAMTAHVRFHRAEDNMIENQV